MMILTKKMFDSSLTNKNCQRNTMYIIFIHVNVIKMGASNYLGSRKDLCFA